MKMKKTMLCSMLILLAAGCQQQPGSPADAPEGASQSQAAMAPAAMSMRATDVRISTGVQQNGKCNIERLNESGFGAGVPTASRAHPIMLTGWIADVASKSVPGKLKVRLQTANGVSAWEQDVTERLDRADVVVALGGDDAYLKSGFRARLDVGQLAPGDYVVYLAFDGAGGEAICGLGRRFTLAT
ncbi:hypothetical protein [Stenotrophomonas acidaminiphila]